MPPKKFIQLQIEFNDKIKPIKGCKIMEGSRFTTEQIIMRLIEIEIHIQKGMSVSEPCVK